MYARIGRFDVVEGKESELTAAYKKALAPFTVQKGFREGTLYIEPGTGSALSITLWETKEDADATAKGDFIETAIALVAPYQKQRPSFTGYVMRARETRPPKM
ncbi:MAG: antibiotic biosynthesis monooxygenase family protein [Alphaproteobacteria bacterium]